MLPIILSVVASVSTFFGGLTAIKNRNHLHLFLGFSAGVILGVVAFDLLPEIFHLVQTADIDPVIPMIALVVGFLAFHIVEKSILIHHSQEQAYEVHRHPHVGVASALALASHSFLDGMGIGLGFQAGTGVGIAVAIAVIAHDFTDGLNTVNLMLMSGNRTRRSIIMLVIVAIAPVLGAFSTLFFQLPNSALVIYLGLFAGFLLYIGASEILPEAHSKHSSYKTIATTVLGALFIFIVTRFL